MKEKANIMISNVADQDNQSRDVLIKIWLERTLNLLARREHSRVELIRKLIAKTCPPEIADIIVDHCLEKGYLSLIRFAECYSKNKAASGYGPKKIRLELNAHEVSSDDISCAFEQIDWEKAKLIALRKIKHTDPIKLKNALYLRGF